MVSIPHRRSFFCATVGLALAGTTAAVAGTATPQPLIYGPAPMIYSYGAAGETARMPLSLTDTPPTFTEGEVVRDGVIAQHTLRVAEARVLTSAVQGRFRELPVGTVLARVEMGADGRRTAWCDLRANTKMMSRGSVDCLVDSRGVGVFDQGWTGLSSYYFTAAGANVVRDPRTLPAKTTFRAALPDERPVLLLGYQWCDGDGVTKPARFARALHTAGDKDWFLNVEGCKRGVVAPIGGGDIDLDTLKVTLSPGVRPEALRYRVTGRLPVIARLSPITIGQTDLTAPPAVASAVGATPPLQDPKLKDARTRALVAAGAPSVIAGPVAKGQPFFTVEVRHGMTGALKQEVRGKGWFFDKALPAGQPVYGVPMAATGTTGLVWCAPRLAEKPPAKSPTRWSAACFPQNATQANWVEAQTAMMSVDLSWNSYSRATTAAVVEPAPIDLPPMTLSYVFAGWSDLGSLMLEVRLDWGEGPQLLRSLRVAPGAEGAMTIKTMGGAIAVRRAGDTAQAEMVKPLEAEGDVIY